MCLRNKLYSFISRNTKTVSAKQILNYSSDKYIRVLQFYEK